MRGCLGICFQRPIMQQGCWADHGLALPRPMPQTNTKTRGGMSRLADCNCSTAAGRPGGATGRWARVAD
jgi:hypothetical protein